LSASRRRQRLAARRRARALGVKPKRVFHAEAARRRAQAANKRRYAERHPARVATSKAQWRTRHPDQAKATQINAKARRRGSPGDITASEWKAILLFYGNRCAKCRASAAKRPLTADHFIPVRAGGTNTWRNVWPLCLSCNVSKRDRIPSDPAPPHVAVLRRTLRKESA
jgi:5-methylcytosine-specific restriction endonuclease McrA